MITSSERQFKIVGQKDVGAEKKNSAENLCVLFLDRSSGPSTPPSPGLAPGQWFEEFLWFLWLCKFPLQEMWHEPTRIGIKKKELWFFVIRLYGWQLSVDTWPIEPCAVCWDAPQTGRSATFPNQSTNTGCPLDLFICQGEDVPLHPPPTNSLIWPPLPPMAAAPSLMPTRPALGPLLHWERDNASILWSNLNM